MKEIKIVATIIATFFLVSCLDTFEFELPEENSITDENEPNSQFTVVQRDLTSWKTITINNLSTEATSYFWDFGDGVTSTTDDASFDYTYNTDETTEYVISLTATDGSGASDTFTFTIIVSEFVVPSFEITQSDAGLEGVWQTIFLSNTSSGAISYLWDFGDGTTSTEFEPEHTYSTNEETSYSISLTATNVNGDSEISTRVFTLEKPKSYLIPTIADGGFELGDNDDYKDENGNPVDDPVGDSRDSWEANFDRVAGKTSTMQISSDAFEGAFAGKFPDSGERYGYQEITISRGINYRLKYSYDFKRNNTTVGFLNVRIVNPMATWTDKDDFYAANAHEELGVNSGYVPGILDFIVPGVEEDSITVGILIYNDVDEAFIDSITLEGLD